MCIFGFLNGCNNLKEKDPWMYAYELRRACWEKSGEYQSLSWGNTEKRSSSFSIPFSR